MNMFLLRIIPFLIVAGGIALGIAAVALMMEGGERYATEATRWPNVVSGIACLAFGSALILAGALLARGALRQVRED